MTRPPAPRSRFGADAGSRIARSRTLQGSLGRQLPKRLPAVSVRFAELRP
jgi:hypothetical protein